MRMKRQYDRYHKHIFFEVLDRVGKLAYRLDIPTESRIHPVISVAHLEPAPEGDDPWEREPTSNEHLPTTDERFPEDTVYEVERILAKRVVNAPGRPRRDGTRQQITKYLIRWKDQSARYDCWVREEDCIGCEDAIKEFEERQNALQPAT